MVVFTVNIQLQVQFLVCKNFNFTNIFCIKNSLAEKTMIYDHRWWKWGLHQWWQKLKNLEGDKDNNFGVNGVHHLENSSVWPIILFCLLPMDDFATFLDFYFLFFICFSYVCFLYGILGGTSPLLKILGGTQPTFPRAFPSLPYFRCLWVVQKSPNLL